MLADVQASSDDRNLPLDEVGISGIRYPVSVADREHGKQDTIAELSMSVDLPPSVRGAHLSRLVEVLHETAGEIMPQAIPAILDTLRARLGSNTARMELSFPFFQGRRAPVTGITALLDYQCLLAGELTSGGTEVVLGVAVPVTSVCPCSKAISDYGAHNQRSTITIRARPCREEGLSAGLSVEDLIQVAEAAASCPVFPLLKRPDERHVTMRAYDHPVFVEDMARAAADTLRRDQRIASFSVEAASDESIHNHGAFARIQSVARAAHIPPNGLRRSS
jgi:GTP cyclohydrolase I